MSLDVLSDKLAVLGAAVEEQQRTTKVVVQEIEDGLHDYHWDDITRAIKHRRELLHAKSVARLAPGDRVQITTRCSPKYLQGLTAVVVGKGTTKRHKGRKREWKVELENPLMRNGERRFAEPFDVYDYMIRPV